MQTFLVTSTYLTISRSHVHRSPSPRSEKPNCKCTRQWCHDRDDRDRATPATLPKWLSSGEGFQGASPTVSCHEEQQKLGLTSRWVVVDQLFDAWVASNFNYWWIIIKKVDHRYITMMLDHDWRWFIVINDYWLIGLLRSWYHGY